MEITTSQSLPKGEPPKTLCGPRMSWLIPMSLLRLETKSLRRLQGCSVALSENQPLLRRSPFFQTMPSIKRKLSGKSPSSCSNGVPTRDARSARRCQKERVRVGDQIDDGRVTGNHAKMLKGRKALTTQLGTSTISLIFRSTAT